jgi:hypothetical protein
MGPLAAWQQWKDVLNEAVKGVLIVFLLDWLRIVSNGAWFERHMDAVSISVRPLL